MGKVICFSCQTEFTFIERVSRKDECFKCGADVRVCKNCAFYDAKVYNECREPQADPIHEKERSNLCDYFTPTVGDAKAVKDQAEKLREAAEALFKKG